MDAVREARTALRRGRSSEALVHLWNALEPARIEGDRRALDTIGGLAAMIAAGGDEADRRDAERLLAAVREAAEEPGGFEGEDVGVATVGDGEPVYEPEELEVPVAFPESRAEPAAPGEAGEAGEPAGEAEETQRSGLPSIWTILFILFVIITIVRNVVEGR